MSYTYNHPLYSDHKVEQAKRLYAEYAVRYIPRAAIGRVAKDMVVSYGHAASMIATKKKEVDMPSLAELVHACYKEMMLESKSKSRHFAIMDVCDRMRLDYDTVDRLLQEEVLVQLTMF